MNKSLSLSVFPLMCFALFFISCKKDKGPSRSELIVGSWERVNGGVDRNNNDFLEASEFEQNSDSTKTFFTFKSDGTGRLLFTVPGVPPVESELVWKITDKDQSLEISYTDRVIDPRILKFTVFTKTQFQGYLPISKPHYIETYQNH